MRESKTVWAGYLGFGLMSIPVRFRAAAREEYVLLHVLHEKCTAGVSQQYSCTECGEVVDAKTAPRYYQASKRSPKIVLTQAELKKLDPPSSRVSTITEFVKITEVDPIYLGTSYHVTPDEGGEKAFSLLRRAMSESGLGAVSNVTMHNREHVVLLRPSRWGLFANLLFYSDEVRTTLGMAEEVPSTEQEISMAVALISAMEIPFTMEGREDRRRANLVRRIKAKSLEVESELPSSIEEAPAAPAAPDILEVLRASLNQRRSA